MHVLTFGFVVHHAIGNGKSMAAYVCLLQSTGEEGALVDLAVAAIEMLATVGNAAGEGSAKGGLGSRRACKTVPTSCCFIMLHEQCA
jgi:hypothetical protein